MSYISKRLLTALLVLLLASVVIFSLLRLAPGNPAVILAGPDATTAQVAAISRGLGLDGSLPAQYWHWLSGIFTGYLGQSYILDRGIGSLIGQRIGSTIQLLIAGTLVMAALGTLLGVLAVSSNRLVSAVVDFISTIALATPPFVSSIIFIFLFAITIHLLPAGGQESFLSDPSFSVQYLLMPSVAVALPGAAVIARLLATEMRRTLREEFSRTATAKGASQLRLLIRHVLPNSIGPAVVELGIRIGELFAGAVVIESIFARSGLGSLLVTAVQDRDYLLAQDLLLLAVAFAIVMQLLIEIGMSRVDRRLALGPVVP
jgi:peptide/nickel transport system permease protein